MNWKKRLCCLVMSAVLMFSLLLPVGAARTAEYTDLPSGHWAYQYIMRCVELGILNGTGNGQMQPDMTLDWGQYLTMCCRVLARERYEQVVQAGEAWNQAAYIVAKEIGLLWENDFLSVSADSLKTPLTRQEVAVLLDRVVPEGLENKWWFDTQEKTLDDVAQMDEQYRQSVERLIRLGIVEGKTDNTFGGSDILKRSDGSTLLARTLGLIDQLKSGEQKEIYLSFVDSAGNLIGSEMQVTVRVRESYLSLFQQFAPENYAFDDEYGGYTYVSTASDRYTIQIRAMSEMEIQEWEARQRYYAGEITYEEYLMQDFWLRWLGENPRKHMLLFGDMDKRRFSSKEEAQAAMVDVTVPIWKLSKGEKVSSTATFSVHYALAEDVVNIFTEIYNDPEQFPMNSIGGFRWRSDTAKGEHNCGTAIDINPNENYQIRYGNIETGSLWKPGENPYSISEYGSVVRIFEKYGWSWGGNAWADDADPSTGYHDYMHFSYMGG